MFVTAGTTNSNQQVIQSGGTANVPVSSFKAGAIVDNNGGGEATASMRFELASELRFGADAPDARESCSATESAAECTTPLTIGTDLSRRSSGWVWDVVAERAGSYVLRAEIVQTSTTDPDLSSNTASATIVVS